MIGNVLLARGDRRAVRRPRATSTTLLARAGPPADPQPDDQPVQRRVRAVPVRPVGGAPGRLRHACRGATGGRPTSRSPRRPRRCDDPAGDLAPIIAQHYLGAVERAARASRTCRSCRRAPSSSSSGPPRGPAPWVLCPSPRTTCWRRWSCPDDATRARCRVQRRLGPGRTPGDSTGPSRTRGRRCRPSTAAGDRWPRGWRPQPTAWRSSSRGQRRRPGSRAARWDALLDRPGAASPPRARQRAVAGDW